MSIGANIKKLRRERDITQEVLAEMLGLTPSAISQWETDRVLPDVSQLPQLCNIFRVSADVILGIDVDEVDERIKEIRQKADDLGCKGHRQEAAEVCRAGLQEFPDAYELMEELVNQLYYVEYPNNGTEHYPEMIVLCEKILEGSKDEQTKNYITGQLCYLYKVTGRIDDAKRLTKSVPHLVYTADDLYLATLTGREWVEESARQQCVKFDRFIWNVRNIIKVCPDGVPYFSDDDRLELYRKLIVFVETFYENGDYGFDGELLAEIYFERSLIFAARNDSGSALDSLEKSLYHTLKSDAYAEGLLGSSVVWPEDRLHTSILAKFTNPENPAWTSSPTTSNNAYEYLQKLTDPRFDAIRSDARFIEVERQLRDNARE